jgi:hypothetical protein
LACKNARAVRNVPPPPRPLDAELHLGAGVADKLFEFLIRFGAKLAGTVGEVLVVNAGLGKSDCNCPGRVVRGSSWTADSDQDLGVLEERLDDVPMVLFGG